MIMHASASSDGFPTTLMYDLISHAHTTCRLPLVTRFRSMEILVLEIDHPTTDYHISGL